jgi:uncharacterized membrane protein
MHSAEVGGEKAFALLSRRHSSLSPAGRVLVFGSLAIVTVAISLGFAFHGAWPVLPFAGLECLALYLVYRWLGRHQGDYQCVTVDGERVVVETRKGTQTLRGEFSQAWAQVVIEEGDDGRPSVFIRSHGRAVEIGQWLTGEGRIEIARRLRRRLAQNHSRNQDHSGGL